MSDKAGAFVLHRGKMVFMMGPTVDRSSLAIVRLGGHKEEGETDWECAQREVYEESLMRIKPIEPAMSFYSPNHRFGEDIILEPASEDQRQLYQPQPLIIGHRNSTPIFLTYSEDKPAPNMETKALILLSRSDVVRLCSQSMTLDEFQSAGGEVLFGEEIDGSLPFKPFGHLRMLSLMVMRYPDALPDSWVV